MNKLNFIDNINIKSKQEFIKYLKDQLDINNLFITLDNKLKSYIIDFYININFSKIIFVLDNKEQVEYNLNEKNFN